jgi:hypothetical protein
MKSKYIEEDHIRILIDNKPLDEILHELYPEQSLLGLIPTITDWIRLESEAQFVFERFATSNNAVLPILMCPDDCDLWCTLVVAEVVKNESQIIWKRIGIDESQKNEMIDSYESIGIKVKWLDKVKEMIFNKENYSVLEEVYKNHKEY